MVATEELSKIGGLGVGDALLVGGKRVGVGEALFVFLLLRVDE